jgi:hypothetical protein
MEKTHWHHKVYKSFDGTCECYTCNSLQCGLQGETYSKILRESGTPDALWQDAKKDFFKRHPCATIFHNIYPASYEAALFYKLT